MHGVEWNIEEKGMVLVRVDERDGAPGKFVGGVFDGLDLLVAIVDGIDGVRLGIEITVSAAEEPVESSNPRRS
jgi:hypothetical protein